MSPLFNYSLIKKVGVLLIALLLLPVTVFAGNVVKAKAQPRSFNDFSTFSAEEKSRIEDNLLVGLKSSNLGLQTSSAYFLGEMKSDDAIIPLMSLLRSGKSDEARIIAALSLYKINSARGLYLIKRLAETENNDLVKRNFERIYFTYLSDKNS
jgi:hypothetical protein